MTAYLIVAAILVALAFVAVQFPISARPTGLLGAVMLALFAGLRYETGYDWHVYEGYFNSLRTIAEICAGVPSQLTLLVEPLYEVLNFVVKAAGGNVWWVFFIAAIFSIGAMWFVAQKISITSVPVVLLVYFGTAYLMAQFAIVRQSIASSFVLLALLMATQSRPVRSGALFIGAVGFHVSTVIFAWVPFMRNIRPPLWLSTIMVGVGFVALLLRVDLIKPIAFVLADYAPLWIAAKAAIYTTVPAVPLSPGTAGLILFHIGILGALYIFPKDDERRDPIIITGMWLTLMVLAAHLYLATFPSVWNRVMIVSIPWEIAVIYRLQWVRERPKAIQHAAVAGLAAFSISAVSYSLIKPQWLPFRPYQSVVHVWMGDQGDGRARTLRAVELYDDLQATGSALSGSRMEALRNELRDDDKKQSASLSERACQLIGYS